jgi:hypothetical protein
LIPTLGIGLDDPLAAGELALRLGAHVGIAMSLGNRTRL